MLRIIFPCLVVAACTQTSPSENKNNRNGEEQAGKQDRSRGKAKNPPPSVKLELIHSSGNFSAESIIEIAAKISIEPGWHIYWESPGDSGLPTSLDIQPRSGFRVEKTRFPVPERFTSPGPVHSFGYANHTVLFTDVKIPRKITTDTGYFRAQLKWLACKTVCIRGKSRAELNIESASPPVPDPIVERFRTKLPIPLPSSMAKIEVSSSKRLRKVDIRMHSGSIVDFFPLANDLFFLDQIYANSRWLSLTYNTPARSKRTFGGRLGVLAVRDSYLEVGYYEVRVDSPVPTPPSQPRE